MEGLALLSVRDVSLFINSPGRDMFPQDEDRYAMSCIMADPRLRDKAIRNP